MGEPLIPGIEHIVVLMLENRSFDNVLGGLYPAGTAAGTFRGLTGNEANPLHPNVPNSPTVKVFQGPAEYQTYITPYPDPGELYTDMVEQLFANQEPLPAGVPPMSGFAWSYGQQPGAPEFGRGLPVLPVPLDIMQYFSAATMPVSWELAKRYAVCDTWFASGPVQTIANRIFAHCGTPGLLAGTNQSRVNNPDFFEGITDTFEPTAQDFTVFEALDNAYPESCAQGPGVPDDADTALNWKVYYHDAPISALCQYVYDNWDFFIGGNVYHFQDEFSAVTNFEKDIQNGALPKYSFIEPRYSDVFGGTVNSNHPGGAGIDFNDPNGSSLPPAVDVRAGETLLNQIHGILAKYPETFAKTLFIVTYDEHGGLYDHVPPPNAVSPFSAPVDNFPYDRYGVRVPTLFINPRIPAGTVYPPREPGAPVAVPPHDHTSLIQTVLQQFGADGPFGPRVASAPPIAGLPMGDAVEPALLQDPVYVAAVSPKRERVTTFHPDAPTLAGALGGLYKKIQEWKDMGSYLE